MNKLTVRDLSDPYRMTALLESALRHVGSKAKMKMAAFCKCRWRE